MDKKEAIIKDIADNRDYKNMCGLTRPPEPGKYYMTEIVADNVQALERSETQQQSQPQRAPFDGGSEMNGDQIPF